MKKLEHPMYPIWMKYPEITMYSIGWRMGYGESYKYKWFEWFEKLSKEEQSQYQKMFPEPKSFLGYWRRFSDLEEASEQEEEAYQYLYNDFSLIFWEKNGGQKYSLEKLRKEYEKGKSIKILPFWGHKKEKNGTVTKSCFSQWWKAKFRVDAEDYCCMEQYMMAEKARLFGDKEIEEQIMECMEPGKIKAYGRKVKGFQEDIWNICKYSIVLNGNYYKFMQNPELKKFLLNTGNKILIEASPYDGIWGIRMSAEEKEIENPMKWKGKNLLGFALMEVRDEIKRVCENESLCESAASEKEK